MLGVLTASACDVCAEEVALEQIELQTVRWVAVFKALTVPLSHRRVLSVSELTVAVHPPHNRS